MAIARGLVSRVAIARGLVSRVAIARGLVSRVAIARGLVSRVAIARGLVSRVAIARGLFSMGAIAAGGGEAIVYEGYSAGLLSNELLPRVATVRVANVQGRMTGSLYKSLNVFLLYS